MSVLKARLRRLEAASMCRSHRTRLVCPLCDPTGELSDDEWDELGALLIRIGLTDSEPRLAGSRCRRCGEPLLCLRCNALRGRELAAYEALSADEQDTLARLLRKMAGPESWLLT
jgi:hypothetical protein